jgi:hypothetical protein
MDNGKLCGVVVGFAGAECRLGVAAVRVSSWYVRLLQMTLLLLLVMLLGWMMLLWLLLLTGRLMGK